MSILTAQIYEIDVQFHRNAALRYVM